MNEILKGCPRTAEKSFQQPSDEQERGLMRRTEMCVNRRVNGKEALFGCRDCNVKSKVIHAE